LDVLFEDEHLIAINKAAGMVVHPAKGHWSGTLASALSYHFQRLSSVGGPTRPGIVHRLDRETSGVILAAKTDQAHLALAAQFEKRSVQKEYFALVQGVPERDTDVISRPIGPHPIHREKMAVRPNHPSSRPAETRYEVMERFDRFAALRILPRTGRTHQIRVHLAHMGCPVLCDRLYAGRCQITDGELRGQGDRGPVLLDRVALHAWRLRILHPVTGEPLALAAPIPTDIQAVLDALRASGHLQPHPDRG
jgi:23S rRNA pseudouridine1911/1915/1917 synthase